MSTLLKLYKEILDYVGFKVNNEGMVDFVISADRTDPAMFSGSRLVLPTPENIKKDNLQKQLVFFSPFSESMFVDETDMQGLLRLYVNNRLNTVFAGIGVCLISLAQSRELHEMLNSEQQKYLFKLGENVDDGTLNDFMKILNKSRKNQPERFFLNAYVQKGGKKDDVKYRRLASMNFNFLKELTEKKGKELGISERSRKVFLSLYSIMTDGICNSVGSHSDVAAYSETLLTLASGYTTHWNNIIDTFKSIDDTIPFSSYRLNHDWMETIQERDEIYKELRILPELEGNSGNRDKPKQQSTTKEIPSWNAQPIQPVVQPVQPVQPSYTPSPVVTQPVAQPIVQPVVQQPVTTMQPQQPATTPGTVSFSSILANPQANAAIAVNAGGMYPQPMMMQQGMYPQQAMMPQGMVPVMGPNGQVSYMPQQGMMQQVMYPQQMVQQPQPQIIQTPQGLMQVVNTPQGQMMVPVNNANLTSQLANTPVQTNPNLPPIPLHFLTGSR